MSQNLRLKGVEWCLKSSQWHSLGWKPVPYFKVFETGAALALSVVFHFAKTCLLWAQECLALSPDEEFPKSQDLQWKNEFSKRRGALKQFRLFQTMNATYWLISWRAEIVLCKYWPFSSEKKKQKQQHPLGSLKKYV